MRESSVPADVLTTRVTAPGGAGSRRVTCRMRVEARSLAIRKVSRLSIPGVSAPEAVRVGSSGEAPPASSFGSLSPVPAMIVSVVVAVRMAPVAGSETEAVICRAPGSRNPGSRPTAVPSAFERARIAVPPDVVNVTRCRSRGPVPCNAACTGTCSESVVAGAGGTRWIATMEAAARSSTATMKSALNAASVVRTVVTPLPTA